MKSVVRSLFICKPQIYGCVIAMLSFFGGQSSKASELELGVINAVVSETNTVPYAIFSPNGKLVGGLSKDILDRLALQMGMQMRYLDVPRARVEQWLKEGHADVACFINPDWVNHPTEYAWTAPLFYTKQLIIQRKGAASIKGIRDLFKKRVGTTRGFVYPELEQAFAEKLIVRDDAHSLQSNLQRLAQGRLDAVMTVDLSYSHFMQQHPKELQFQVDSIWTPPPPVFCAVSQKSAQRVRILNAFNQLQENGEIGILVSSYLVELNASIQLE